ncbi:ferrous iron transport protein A [Ferrimonas balearica]|uniref:FeoA family protein n=1 Tax=Ferrimonas balearica TaxID=44012 RepID=UPI001C993FBF|nr:FeoA family protein [Ferrimonas balearica]MBY5991045.1 ferrous iron transport protein A [Ferrimonas balearica]
MTLAEMVNGQKARVAKFQADGLESSTQLKLAAMGLAPGCEVQLIRRAPLGRSIQLKLAGASICLNHQLATQVSVEVNQ